MWFSQSSWRGWNFQPGGISLRSPALLLLLLDSFGLFQSSCLASSEENQSLPGMHHELLWSSHCSWLWQSWKSCREPLSCRGDRTGGGWRTGRGHRVTVTWAGASLSTQHQVIQEAPQGERAVTRAWKMEEWESLKIPQHLLEVQPKSCSPERVLLAFSR